MTPAQRRKPTIYEALATKLGRRPTNEELKADVSRIKREAVSELATHGKLPHQKRARVKPTKKKLLFMQLKCPSFWWPRDAKKKPAWVGVLVGGCGWTLGEGDLMTAAEIVDAKDSIKDSYPEAKFEIRRAP